MSPLSPSSTAPDESGAHDALDRLEARILRWCTDPPPETNAAVEGWQALFAPLSGDLPAPEEAGARSSSAEARFLLRVLDVDSAPPLVTLHPAAPRAGYRLDKNTGRPPQVFPQFAAMLAQPGAVPLLADTFPDLVLIDGGLWQLLATNPTQRAVARAWLASPGRRLVQQLAVLRSFPAATPIGATDASRQAIYRAAGVSLADAAPPAWRERHDVVPGLALATWEPADTSDLPGPLRALRLLETPDPLPPSVRGAALLWLLRRAATRPEYRVEGLRRDLREDLTPRLVALLDLPTASRGGPARLEATTLLFAAWLTHGDGEPGVVRRAYHVARWLHECLLRSPFHGQDPEVLAARLTALLPPPEVLLQCTAPTFTDPLGPGRFGDVEGPNLGPLTVVMAAGQHYLEGDQLAAQSLRPVPPPLADALRQIAALPLSQAERALDQRARSAPTELPSQLGHLAPPLLARALLSRLKVPWLASTLHPVQDETLSLYLDEPGQHPWVPFVIQQEAAGLPEPLQRRIQEAYLHADLPDLDRALLALAILGALGDDAIPDVIALCSRAGADKEWPPALLDELAREGDRLGRPVLLASALSALHLLAADHQRPETQRLKAALSAIRRIAATPKEHRPALLAPWTQLLQEAPFRDIIPLQRELRRLGVLATPQSP